MKSKVIFSTMFMLLVAVSLLFYSSCEKDDTANLLADNTTTIQTDELATLRGNASVPFKGTYYIVSSEIDYSGLPYYIKVDFVFEGNATHLGKSTWTAIQYIDAPSGDILPQSTFTLTAANGDEFTGNYDGTSKTVDEVIHFEGTMYVTAECNTGRFECVTGELYYEGYNAGSEDAEFYFGKNEFGEVGFLDFTDDDCDDCDDDG